jgi:poly(hydroxyalkanoate) depolymerase family esterase
MRARRTPAHPILQDPTLNLLAKLLGRAGARGPDASAHITDTIDRALAVAGLAQHAGPGVNVRATIDRALTQAGLVRPLTSIVAMPQARAASRAAAADAIATPTPAGEWIARSFSNDAGTRSYMLYVPATYARVASAPVPLVVMLHGCTQSPDDFAAGTRMNQLADVHGFLVAYPAQTANANGAKCWNWFRPEDQAHGRGEPSLIAGIARQVASDYRIDPRRVFVAGLSAGAAMAVILGETYPQVFAAVGAHSGLPFAAAHDMASAFTAMKAGPGQAAATPSDATHATMPTIVFHGDADHTVAASNGRAIVRDASVGADITVETGETSGGRSYTRKVFADAAGRARGEHWLVHGTGHAWSGGSAQGSYTDPAGPDASAEMVRFFLQLAPGAR